MHTSCSLLLEQIWFRCRGTHQLVRYTQQQWGSHPRLSTPPGLQSWTAYPGLPSTDPGKTGPLQTLPGWHWKRMECVRHSIKVCISMSDITWQYYKIMYPYQSRLSRECDNVKIKMSKGELYIYGKVVRERYEDLFTQGKVYWHPGIWFF